MNQRVEAGADGYRLLGNVVGWDWMYEDPCMVVINYTRQGYAGIIG